MIIDLLIFKAISYLFDDIVAPILKIDLPLLGLKKTEMDITFFYLA